MFLPEGFPQSVSRDYLRYQVFDSLQAFCSSIAGQLSTQSVLRAIGVGSETATAVGATVTWMSRDGVGMAGRILFASRFAKHLDENPKGWRLVADVFNDAAMLLEIAAGTHGWENAWPVLCFTSVLRGERVREICFIIDGIIHGIAFLPLVAAASTITTTTTTTTITTITTIYSYYYYCWWWWWWWWWWYLVPRNSFPPASPR